MATLEMSTATAIQGRKALVDRVLASQQFRRTVRLRDFLRYVAAKSIDHPGGLIPEQEIGAAVFGRSADYDTGTDNIVRVSAGDLRRRLEHYFFNEGAHEAVVLEMPRGAYTLVFRDRVQPGAPVEMPAMIEPEPEPAISPEMVEVAGTVQPELPSAHSTHFLVWLRDIRTLSLTAVCLCLAALCIYLPYRSDREPWQKSSALQDIWSDFFQPGTETDIVLADSSLALVKSITRSGVNLSDYLGYHYEALQNDPHFDSETRSVLSTILARNIGSIGDFQAARKILALTSHPKQLMLGSAHDFTPEAIKGKNVVLLGSSESNPWVDLFRSRRSFLLEKSTPDAMAVVRNLEVHAGEQQVYGVDAGKSDVSGYAVIALLHNIEPEKRVMIVEGTDSQATLAASSFITSAAGAKAIQEHLQGKGLPAHLEILLSSSKLLTTALQARIVTVHVRNDPQASDR